MLFSAVIRSLFGDHSYWFVVPPGRSFSQSMRASDPNLGSRCQINQMEQYQRDNVRLKAKCQLLTLVTNNCEMSLTLSIMGTIVFFSPLTSSSLCECPSDW